MANHDADVIVNVSGSAQQVAKKNFGLPLWATPNVEAGFTDFVREYRSNSNVQADVDLSAPAKAAGATFFSQPERPGKLLIGKGVIEAGGGGELAASLAAIQLVRDDFYGVGFDSRADLSVAALAAWLPPTQKMGIVQSSAAAISAATPGNPFVTAQAAANGRCAGLWHHEDLEYADLAWLAVGLSIDMDQESGVWYDRTLVGPTVSDDLLTDTQQSNIMGDGIDTYGEGGNLYLTQRTVGTVNPARLFDSRYIDDRIVKDWTIARVGERLAQFKIDLANRNQKIPYNNDGFAMIRGVVLGVLTRGSQIGHFTPGTEIVTVPDIFDPASGIDPTDIANRHFDTLTATATLAGGIRTIEITIGLLNA